MIFRSDNFQENSFLKHTDSGNLFSENITMIIRAITKSSQKVLNQYTVYFMDGSCLTLSSNPDSPQGISQWGDTFGISDIDWEEAIENNNQLVILGQVEELINFSDLPSIIQAHIEKRIAEAGQK